MKSVLKHTVALVPGEYLAPGTEVDLKKPDRDRLQAAGALQPAAAPASAATGPAKPKGKALQEAIVAAIGVIDPENAEGWTRDGRPAVAALERLLGYDITQADRDAAWDAYRHANPDLFKG